MQRGGARGFQRRHPHVCRPSTLAAAAALVLLLPLPPLLRTHLRRIPGTQHSHELIPLPEEEETWMKLSVACPVPAGAALIRDLRCCA